MRGKTLGKVLGVVMLVAMLSPTAFAGPARVVGRYLGGTPAGGALLPISGPSYTLPDHPNIGGMWIRVPSGRTQLSVAVVDDVSEAVAVDVLFLVDEYAPLIPSRRFCNAAYGLQMPAGTKSLLVRVLDLGSLGCSPRGVPTQGTITATFS